MTVALRRLLLTLLCIVLCSAPGEGKEKIDVFTLAEYGTPEELKQAVAEGADFNVKVDVGIEGKNLDFESILFDYGDTPLHHAAMYNHNPQSIAFLITQGLDVEAKASSGNIILENPLSCAVRNKNVEAVRTLLERGANPNSWSSNGGKAAGTPFHVVAIEYEDEPFVAKRIVEALIESGGNVNNHLELSSEELAAFLYEKESADGKIFILEINGLPTIPLITCVTSLTRQEAIFWRR